MTPEQIAADFIERTRVPPGVRGQFTDELAAIIAAALDDARAEERQKAIRAAQEVVAHILATTVVPFHNPATYDGGKRVGAQDVLSALLNLD